MIIRPILFCLMACLLALRLTAQQLATETIEKSYPLATGGLVALENINGSLRVEGWDKDEVKIVAEKRLTETSRVRLADLEVRINAGANAIFIDTEYPNYDYRHAERGVDYITEVNYTLYVPKRASIRTKLVNSKVTLHGLCGDHDIETVNGSIDCPLTALTEDAHIRLRTVNGRVQVLLGKDYSGTVQASNVHGRIRSDISSNFYKSEPYSKSYHAILGNSRQEVRVSNVNGGIEIQRQP